VQHLAKLIRPMDWHIELLCMSNKHPDMEEVWQVGPYSVRTHGTCARVADYRHPGMKIHDGAG